MRDSVFTRYDIDMVYHLPSGKHTKNYGKSPLLIGKSTTNGPFSIAIIYILYPCFITVGIIISRNIYILYPYYTHSIYYHAMIPYQWAIFDIILYHISHLYSYTHDITPIMVFSHIIHISYPCYIILYPYYHDSRCFPGLIARCLRVFHHQASQPAAADQLQGADVAEYAEYSI